MSLFPIFLSVVYVVRNQGKQIESTVRDATDRIGSLVTDYELIIIDNASNDNSLCVFPRLTAANGYPNLQVYALTKEVDSDTAAWVGLENALGDFVCVFNPQADDLDFLPRMLDEAVNGADVVFAYNTQQTRQSVAYRAANSIFDKLYKTFNGVNLTREAPQYRVLSKQVINFILQHAQPAVTYRHLPATGGFSRVNMEYSASPRERSKKKFWESVDRGMRLLVSTTRAPMRIVTALSLFGAGANFVYTIYVVAVSLFRDDVAPGWTSMSLQQSGMFLLISLVLLVLGEYILQMASLSNEGPLYHVGQEFTSEHITRRSKLNVEETTLPNNIGSNTTAVVNV